MSWLQLIIAFCVLGQLPTNFHKISVGALICPTYKNLDSKTFGSKHLVQVNSTTQSFQFIHPWKKNPPITKAGIGVMVEGGHLLVTAELVADHTYVEIEIPHTGKRTPAKVVRVDYDYNLALLRPEVPLPHLIPCKLDLDAKPGHLVQILKFLSNGQIDATEGTFITATIALYPAETSQLLLFRILTPYLDNNVTQPVFRKNKLTGIVVRTDPQNQSYQVIPAQVIQHFIKNTPPYTGVPQLGCITMPTRDPQLRKALQLPPSGGIYICKVEQATPANKAGLLRGDILLAIDEHALDEQGNIHHPDFVKINFQYLISTHHRIGDYVTIRVLRNGKFLEFAVQLTAQSQQNRLSPAYVRDQQPGYYILGGLIFTELSRPYLQEWGTEWKARAPQRLLYVDQYQNEWDNQGKLVFLSEILPSEHTVGFYNNHMILKELNGYPIHNLKDLATAAGHSINGSHKLVFLEDPHVFYLDAAGATKIDQKLIEDYSIPATTNISTIPSNIVNSSE